MEHGNPAFFVGTGFSLLKVDLDRIKDEFSIGVNAIHEIFPFTEWRPSVWLLYGSRAAYAIPRYKESKIVARAYSLNFLRFSDRTDITVLPDCYHPSTPPYRWCENEICAGEYVSEPIGTGVQLLWDWGYDPVYLLGCEMTGNHFYDQTRYMDDEGAVKSAWRETSAQAIILGKTIINLSQEEDIDWNLFTRG